MSAAPDVTELINPACAEAQGRFRGGGKMANQLFRLHGTHAPHFPTLNVCPFTSGPSTPWAAKNSPAGALLGGHWREPTRTEGLGATPGPFLFFASRSHPCCTASVPARLVTANKRCGKNSRVKTPPPRRPPPRRPSLCAAPVTVTAGCPASLLSFLWFLSSGIARGCSLRERGGMPASPCRG